MPEALPEGVLYGTYIINEVIEQYGAKARGPPSEPLKPLIGGRLADLPTGLALARMHGEDAPAHWAAFLD